jgi:hypothetical protein
LVYYNIFAKDYSNSIVVYKDLTGDYKGSTIGNGGLKMANNGDWLPSREQDLADLCQKWKAGLNNPANVTNFGWKQAEVTETLIKVTAFLTARTAYEEIDSTANRMAKDEAR